MCARVNYNDLNKYYKKGIYHYNNKDYDDAIFYFEKIVKYDQNFKDTKEKLSNCFYEKEIENKNRMKKERQKEKKLKQKEKKRLRIIAQNAQLPYDDQIKLLEQIDNGKITNEEELQNSIKLKDYDRNWSILLERKKELKKIVDNADLDISSKRNLKVKINKNLIVDEDDLKEEIKKEELKKIVENIDLDSSSKRNLIEKINRRFIIDEDGLKEQIAEEKELRKKEQEREEEARKKEHKRKKELREIVGKTQLEGPVKFDLQRRIEKGLISDEDELKNAILEEENKANLRDITRTIDLDTTSKSAIFNKIQYCLIKTEEELMKEIEIEKTKTELRRIIESANLDYKSKSNLLDKINRNIIKTENELMKGIEIEKELRKKEQEREEELRKEEQERKRRKTEIEKLKKIIECSGLDPKSKSNLLDKINRNIIKTENELWEEIRSEKDKEDWEKVDKYWRELYLGRRN